ncbi:MAG: hypothetical protein RIT45_1680 [Pseudomonadota bacterium]
MTLAANTHLRTEARLVGTPDALAPGYARCHLATRDDMVVDEHGLVHGGFAFGLADYAAMLAVNDPNVVLGSAETRFLAPVKKGDVLVAEARVTGSKGRRRSVEVVVRVGDREVVRGRFETFVLPKHVLAAR